MVSANGSLAAHFPTKRRIFSAPGATPDALVKQAQSELQSASSEAERVAFRFDFDLGNESGKKKNKKKKKKKKKKPSADKETGDAVEGVAALDHPGENDKSVVDPESTGKTGTDVASTPVKSKKKKKKTRQPTKDAAPVEKAADPPTPPVAPVEKDAVKEEDAKKEVPPPPGFLKLRKPTSSDSEVMKMQLRYGRGKRNVAAIAQREKQRQAASASVPSDAAGFQFNFF